jgi:hypothetical protein
VTRRHPIQHRRTLVIVAAAMLAGGLAAPAPARAEPTFAPTFAEALAALTVDEEARGGYDPDLFRHWTDEDGDSCSTPEEVLIAEAVMAPSVAEERCAITGGRWYSYYDDTYVDGADGLTVDHTVPFAEAWESGAEDWDAARREAYANDIGAVVAMTAVTAETHEAKADRDPAEWMPPAEAAACRYAYEWVSVKTRWRLSIDRAEAEALDAIVAGCPDAAVTVPAP